MRRYLAQMIIACGLLIAACGDTGNSSTAPRPDDAEMARRASLVGPAMGYSNIDASKIGQLQCFLDDDYDQFGYQLGMQDADLNQWVTGAVIACSTDEWTKLTEAIATAFQISEAEVAPLVDRAVAAANS